MRISDWSSDVCSSDLSIAWSAYGWMTAQDNLLIQNLILLAINLLGIWRWLGRTARYEEGAEAASEEAETPMVSAAALAGLDAVDREGERIGSVVDAMIACDSGRMAYRSEEHTSELQSLMRISYAVFCLKQTNTHTNDDIYK